MKIIISESIFKYAPYFDLTTTDTTYYNDIMKKPEYMFWEKGLDGELEYMTPMNYYRECASMQKTSVNDQIKYVNTDTATKYKKQMLDGEKFPILVIDEDAKTQEGRHRAFAVQSINPYLLIPVLIVRFYSWNFRKDLIEIIKKLHERSLSCQEIKEKISNFPLNEKYCDNIVKGYYD